MGRYAWCCGLAVYMQVLTQLVPCHKHVRVGFCLFISCHQDDIISFLYEYDGKLLEALVETRWLHTARHSHPSCGHASNLS